MYRHLAWLECLKQKFGPNTQLFSKLYRILLSLKFLFICEVAYSAHDSAAIGLWACKVPSLESSQFTAEIYGETRLGPRHDLSRAVLMILRRCCLGYTEGPCFETYATSPISFPPDSFFSLKIRVLNSWSRFSPFIEILFHITCLHAQLRILR